mgnify:CR=1 FL=1
MPISVALRKESVDRKDCFGQLLQESFLVALRKESVDRKLLVPELHSDGISSLSARRAWIEKLLVM